MVDRYGKSRGVGRAANGVEAIVDGRLGVCLESGILARFGGGRRRRNGDTLDDISVI